MKGLIVCIGCERVMEDEGFALCDACYLWQSDDCPCCGSQGTELNGERFCSCDLNSPRYDTTYRSKA